MERDLHGMTAMCRVLLSLLVAASLASGCSPTVEGGGESAAPVEPEGSNANISSSADGGNGGSGGGECDPKPLYTGADPGEVGGSGVAEECRTSQLCQENHPNSVTIACRFFDAPCFPADSPPYSFCDSSSDCYAGFSCFACPQGASVRVGPCTVDADCPTGAICAAQGCIAAPCATSTECPSDFECAAGSCANRACTDDCDCDGYCIGGFCTAKPGTCEI